MPSETSPGHFLTFIEADTKYRDTHEDNPPPGTLQPSIELLEDVVGSSTYRAQMKPDILGALPVKLLKHQMGSLFRLQHHKVYF